MSETEQETPHEAEKPAEEPVETPDAEPGETDEEMGEQDESDGEEQRPTGASEADWEARFKKSEQRFNTYERAVFGIFEEDAHDLIPCPLCLGAVRGFVDRNAAGRVPEEQAALVKHFLGITREIEYPHGSQYKTCPECEGLGKVATGSRVPGQENIGCGSCNENGWLGPATVVTNGRKDVPEGLTGPTVFPETQAGEDVDEWHEPRILPDGRQNPNFGKMPHRKIQVEPWGTTAGLTAQDKVPA